MNRFYTYIGILTSLCIPLSFLLGDDSFIQQEEQAQAYFAAQDYNKASNFYLTLLENELPDWQQALAYYNLSTIALAQNRWKEALSYLHIIPLSSISSPRLLENILNDQALAYYQEASSVSNATQQFYFYQQSLDNLTKTNQVYCHMQKLENPTLKKCSPLQSLNPMSLLIQDKQSEARQKQRDSLLVQGNLFANLDLLIESLNRFKNFIYLISSSTDSKNRLNPYISFIQQQQQAITPLWKNLQEQTVTEDQKKQILSASTHYNESLEQIEKEQWKESLALLKTTQQELLKIRSGNDLELLKIQNILLDYKILLTAEYISPLSIKRILRKQKSIKNADESTRYLQNSLAQLDSQNARRFFLLAAYYKLEDMSSTLNASKSPLNELSMVLEEENRALELNRLSHLDEAATIQKEALTIALETQDKTIEQANLFLESVYNFEKANYQKIGALEFPRCQTKPWLDVIPLFEKGFYYATQARKGFDQPSIESLAIQANQEEALIYWQKALDNLEIWSKSIQQNFAQANEENQAPSKTQEIYQSLQEMHLEDSPPAPKPNQDLHAW